MSNFDINKLNIQGDKTTICSIILILVLALSSLAILVPKVSAQATGTGIDLPQWAYINAFPTPIGVGQPLSLFFWTADLEPTASGVYGDRWTNMTIVETLPDGTKTTLGPYTSDPVGTIFVTITPTETGNYTFQGFFPGHLISESPNGIDPTQLAQAQAYATAHNVPLATGEALYVSGWAWIGDYYEPCQSDIVTVTVQSTPIPSAPAYPLPTEYWGIPVDQAGHVENWQYITGDWLAQGIAPNYQGTSLPEDNIGGIINDYTSPPTTDHIAWTLPIQDDGGVAGSPQALAQSSDGYYSYMSYETEFGSPIIMNGQLYYNTPNPPEYGFMDINLATGKEVWYQNGTDAWAGTNSPNPLQIGGFDKNNYPQLSFGQELNYESPNQAGVIDTLWSIWTASNGSNVWSAFDPTTGNWICNLWNVPSYSSTLTTDAYGDMIIYTLNFATKTLTEWNSTEAIENTYESSSTLSQTGQSLFYGNSSNSYWFYRLALGQQIDARVEGNTVYPITGNLPATASTATIIGVDQADQEMIYTIRGTVSAATVTYPTPATYTLFAISINPTNSGTTLWSQTYPWPTGNLTLGISQTLIGNGVFCIFQKETRLWMGFSTTTGAQLWTTTTPEIDNHMYCVNSGGTQSASYIADGVLYSGDTNGGGGNIYAYNVTNGDLIFDSQSGTLQYNGYWQNIPMTIKAFAAGNIYWGSMEHSPEAVLEPGFTLGDVNATNGASLWSIPFWDSGIAVADGYMVALNLMDMQIYSFGRGPTSTTVQAPLTGISVGQSFTIQGSVLDISSGTKQDTVAKQFPQGVAAVSDASMTQYMEYVYQQDPVPSNTTGVPVQVTLIDPNGNTINLPAVTSDMDGHYSLEYTAPNIPGEYTAIATFHGTNAYWPSYSETSFTVTAAPAATAAPTATPTSVADMYFVPMSIGIIVLIVIVAVVLALLMLRKKP